MWGAHMGNKDRADVRLTSDAGIEEEYSPEAADGGEPFTIVVLADMAGAEGRRAATALPGRRLMAIDRDNFDQVLRRLDVRWQGTLESGPGSADTGLSVEVRFESMDDFHPDRLVELVPPLRSLRLMLRGLEDPSRVDEIAS